MVQLMIDYATHKILGFNRILPRNVTDLVVVEEAALEQWKESGRFDRLYYENGEIVEKDEDVIYQELRELEDREAHAGKILQKESKLFMEYILSGKTVEESLTILKDNRRKLAEIKDLKRGLMETIKNKKFENINYIFENEEETLRNKHFLSIVTVVRDENDYLVEWLDYHIDLLGVDHVYLYDNESLVPVQEYLEKIGYRYRERITVIPWMTSEHTQQDTCNHWLQHFGRDTRWFVVMDPDEFVHIHDSAVTLQGYLRDHSDCAAIKCLWRHYTAGGQVKRSSLPVRERFTVDTDWGEEKGGGKTFAQSNRVSHFISYVPQVRMQSMQMSGDDTKDYFRLDHYITKSYEEWLEKIERGSVNPLYKRKYQQFFEINPDMAYLNTGEQTTQQYGTAAQIRRV